MGTVDEAKRRLEGALAKLESAIDHKVRGEESRIQQLTAELAEARRETAELQQLNEQITARLEAAIARLRGVLDV